MLIKATKAFVGEVSMIPGQVQDVSDEIAKDLIQAGYAEANTAKSTATKSKQTVSEPTKTKAKPTNKSSK